MFRSNHRFDLHALQIGFTDKIDPALSLTLISQSALAFLNRHLPLTPEQRLMMQDTAGSNTTALPRELSDATQHNDEATDTGRRLGTAQKGTGSMQPGDVVPGQLSDGVSQGAPLHNRTYSSRVLPEERQVFEDICKGHIASLELSL